MSFVSIFRSVFFFLCLLFSLLGYSAYQLNISIDRKDGALRHQAELSFLGDLLAKGSDYLTAEVRSYVQFGNKVHYDNFWREVNKARSRDMVVEKLKSLKVFPENLKYIEIAKEYSDNLIKTEKEAMNEVEAGNYRAARELVFGEYYAEQKKLIMENIENFQGAINKIAFNQTREAESNAELFIDLTNFLLILSGLVVLLFFYFIGIKELVRPMKALTSLMLKIAQGNLEEKIPHVLQDQNNEIGAMASTLEFFKGRLIKQQEVEESIQKERQGFLNMLDQLPVSFHLQASDYTVPFANQMFRNQFGDPETGKCYKLMHNREIPCEPCPTFKIFDSLKTTSSIWKSPDEKSYLSVVTPFDDINGESLLMEMSIDITNEEKYRKSQVQSEKRFKTIFEESPLGVALINSITGDIYEVNVKYAEIVGRSLAEMATIDWMSITHPDDVQEDLENMENLNSGKIQGFNMEKRLIRPDGSHVWINMTISPLTGEDKNKPLHLAMIEDITEKKSNEKDITIFGRVLSSSSNEIYMFSSVTLKFIQVNLGACENLGYSMDELSQSTPLDLKPNFNLETFEKLIKPLRDQTEIKVVFETVHKRKDESLYPVNVILQLIHEESPPLFVAIIEDITERKKVESALKQYHNNLEDEINRRTLELKKSQDQLIHSEKLSTLGAFAGTV
ncbi:PAS domain S-box protein, partial [Nitrospinae bacterium]|nr:PAS domain S-box protein [Nitrospinota bacterium]